MLVATSNFGKLREIKNLLGYGFKGELLSLADFPLVPPPEENAVDCAGNALIKAREYAGIFQINTLADDTALECAALNGWPGVHAARIGTTDEERRTKLLLNLQLKETAAEFWVAEFVCVLCFCVRVHADWEYHFFTGRLPGFIRAEKRGHNGFGYDPIFYLSDGRTLAELSLAEKNLISHRAVALQEFKNWYNYREE
jgi:XTP/dITP diphosphohydrolase